MSSDHRDERKPPKGAITVNNQARKKRPRAVRASELAQMGVCERLVVFEHRFGKRSTEHQRQAIKRGLKVHAQFYREGILASDATEASDKKGRCYIATLIFGPGRETAALRIIRDRVLRPYATGRWLIRVYYRTAPGLCVVLERYSWLQPVIRTMLKPIVWLADHALRGNGGDRAT
jgi:hypothetical protein